MKKVIEQNLKWVGGMAVGFYHPEITKLLMSQGKTSAVYISSRLTAHWIRELEIISKFVAPVGGKSLISRRVIPIAPMQAYSFDGPDNPSIPNVGVHYG